MAANQVRERWRRAAIMHGLKLQPRQLLSNSTMFMWSAEPIPAVP